MIALLIVGIVQPRLVVVEHGLLSQDKVEEKMNFDQSRDLRRV